MFTRSFFAAALRKPFAVRTPICTSARLMSDTGKGKLLYEEDGSDISEGEEEDHLERQRERPRRNRKSATMRAFAQETFLAPQHFVLPLFIHAGNSPEPIASMPGCSRLDLDSLLREAEAAQADGVHTIEIFPKIADDLKTPDGVEALNDKGLVPQAIRRLKQQFPNLTIVTDIALDPYNSDGHDGLVMPNGVIANDATIEILCEQARMHADAGADVVAPSDMMDGRVGAIRDTLDDWGYDNVSIISYTAKYASAFYGPFRDALDSAPRVFGNIPGHKKTYQMSCTNVIEAMREVTLDEDEGADILMVKPAGAYLDVIKALKEESNLPIAAYQVSGEYAMIKAVAEKGWLDEKTITMESLMAIRRAGASCIFTYAARDAARWLREGYQF